MQLTSTYVLVTRDVLAGHSVVDSSQADLPVIIAAVVDPLTHHLQVVHPHLAQRENFYFPSEY